MDIVLDKENRKSGHWTDVYTGSRIPIFELSKQLPRWGISADGERGGGGGSVSEAAQGSGRAEHVDSRLALADREERERGACEKGMRRICYAAHVSRLHCRRTAAEGEEIHMLLLIGDDIICHIISFLRLQSIQHTLGVSNALCRATRRHITVHILPHLVPLTHAPFNLALATMPKVERLRLFCRRIDDEALSIVARALATGWFSQVLKILLDVNQIGDTGIAALADALSGGALADLEVLSLCVNKIGNEGLGSLSEAIASGSLVKLQILSIRGNQIGDAGVEALAGSMSSGLLPNLTRLNVGSNLIGNTGIAALAASSSGALDKLIELRLSDNKFGDAGLISLSAALSSGSLPQLQVLNLYGNKIGDTGFAALEGALSSGSLPKLVTLYVGDGPLQFENPSLKVACDARGIRMRCSAHILHVPV